MYNSMGKPPAVGIAVLVYGELVGEVDGYTGTGWAVATRSERGTYYLEYTDVYSVEVTNPLAWMPLPDTP